MRITELFDYVENRMIEDFEWATHRILDDDRKPLIMIDVDPIPEYEDEYDTLVAYAAGWGGTIIQEWNPDTWQWEDVIS